MSRVCQLTGTRANNGMAVSHSHIRTKKLQQANLPVSYTHLTLPTNSSV